MRKQAVCLCKTKMQISFVVDALLISAFVFTTQIVHYPGFLLGQLNTSVSFIPPGLLAKI